MIKILSKLTKQTTSQVHTQTLKVFVGPIANLKAIIFSRVCLSVCMSLTGTPTLQR